MAMADFLARLSGSERRRRERAMTARCEALAAERAALATALAEGRAREADAARSLADLRDRCELLQRRARSLERILQLAARIKAMRSLNDVLDQIAQAVRESLGFRMVLLRIYSPATQSFEARAFAGIDDDGKAQLAGLQVSLEQYRKLTQPRFKLSESYFISHTDEQWSEVAAGGYTPQLGARAPDEWHEEDMLIVPLRDPADGEVRGYLSVDDPEDRRIPSLDTMRLLELFAAQAVIAIDTAALHERLARSNGELARASDLLQNLNEMKSNFVANVSHELRTPLTSIKAYTETLVHNQAAMSETMRQEFLGVIHQESEKLTAIIDNILHLSRLEDGPARINRSEIDLAEVVGAEAKRAAAQASAKGIHFQARLSASPLPLHADAAQLAQVVAQLLDNAFKFTPAGGSVRLVLTDGIASVRLVVEDDGIGIPADKMEYIFDRFFQADGSSTREHGGQGVGLAICRDIVQWHEGQIWAENLSPQGTRFQVVLPRRNRVVQRVRAEAARPVFNDPRAFVEKLVHWIGETMGVRSVSLMTPDEHGDQLVVEAAVGLAESIVQATRVRRGEGIAGKVWVSGRSLLVTDVAADPRLGKRSNDPQYATPSLLSVPLLEGLACIGVVNVNNRLDGRAFNADDLLLLESLAPRVAHLLTRLRGFTRQAEEFVALRDALRTAAALRRERCDHLADACHEICLATARRLKLPQEELENLAFALRFYDVGLSRVSSQLLRKPQPLSGAERDLIRQHVRHGLEILQPLETSPKVRQIIAHHHERYDGEGYPDRLEGEAIPIGARLLALTDSLNAMLQGRPYRPPLALPAALAEIERLAGSQFCPRLAASFLLEARQRASCIAALQQEATTGEASEDAAPAEPISSLTAR